jgi:hypothetical protein
LPVFSIAAYTMGTSWLVSAADFTTSADTMICFLPSTAICAL